MTNWAPVRKAAVAIAGTCLLAVFAMGMFVDRKAGWPHDLADLEGRWVLDHVRGEIVGPLPETIWFSSGIAGESIRISDGVRTAEFVIPGVGRMVFQAGQQFDPLLPAGASSVHTMTHLWPGVPEWDHLAFFLDGMPTGSPQRVAVYERE